MPSAIGAIQPIRRPRPKWMDALAHWFRPYELLTEEEEKAGKAPQFRYLASAAENWGLQVILFTGMALLFPHFLHSQLRGGPLLLLATFLVIGAFVVAPVEWFLHRFGMHNLLVCRALEWLEITPEDSTNSLIRLTRRIRNSFTIRIVYYIAKMAFGHGAHHKVTDVTPINPSRLTEMFHAISRYEILLNPKASDAGFGRWTIKRRRGAKSGTDSLSSL